MASLFWKFTDYFMDFEKVRKFQELCGLQEAEDFQPSFKRCFGRSNYKVSCNEDLKCNNLYDRCSQDVSFSNVYERRHCSSKQVEQSNVQKLSDEEYAKTYKVNNWFLFYLFKFGSTLGHEIFYITFIPYVFWNIDPFIGRKMAVVWVVTMYIGQALKDTIRWPRPHWPPVFKLETRVEAEYGIPSTHAVAGTVLPFSVLLSMYGRYEFPVEIGILLACSWCALVAFSRIYVGMHSILDVMAGILLAATYLCLGWPFMDMVEQYTLASTYAPGIIVLSHFLLGVFYPSTDHYSTSRGDTVTILASGAGLHVGSWFCYYYHFDYGPTGSLPYPVTMPTLHSFGISLSRTFVGFIVIFIVRLVMKYLSLSLVCSAVGVSKKDPASRRRKDVEVTYKFITYFMVGFSSVLTAPLILEIIGLSH